MLFACPARFILKMLHRQPLFTQSVPKTLPRDRPKNGFAAAYTATAANPVGRTKNRRSDGTGGCAFDTKPYSNEISEIEVSDHLDPL